MLIDNTYFEENNFIPNTQEPDPNSKLAKNLALMIALAEKDVLSFAFGFTMWQDFKTQFEANTLSAEYKKILDGGEYTVDGNTRYWPGLVQPETKESLLADYVYVQYHTKEQTQTTELGEVAIESKVGGRVSLTPKLTRAWNSFVRKLQGGVRNGASGLTTEGNPYWVSQNRLGTGSWIDYYGMGVQNGEVSLMQFLFDNKTDYPLLDTNYRRFGAVIKNEFGI